MLPRVIHASFEFRRLRHLQHPLDGIPKPQFISNCKAEQLLGIRIIYIIHYER